MKEILNLGGGKISRGLGPGPFFLRDFRPDYEFSLPPFRCTFTQNGTFYTVLGTTEPRQLGERRL
jgi:hypothetical protein